VQFTASAELHDKLERLRALMRSQVPDGDLAAVIEQAVTEKLERLEARRFARTSAPRSVLSETDTSPSSRHIPAAVRRAVRERDGNRCRYVDVSGALAVYSTTPVAVVCGDLAEGRHLP
jgi:predicted DNA-binding transcriptional regulator YafY